MDISVVVCALSTSHCTSDDFKSGSFCKPPQHQLYHTDASAKNDRAGISEIRRHSDTDQAAYRAIHSETTGRGSTRKATNAKIEVNNTSLPQAYNSSIQIYLNFTCITLAKLGTPALFIANK